MKTIEEMGQIVLDAWYAYWRKHGLGSGEEKHAAVEVAKAIITAVAEDGVSWAPGDD